MRSSSYCLSSKHLSVHTMAQRLSKWICHRNVKLTGRPFRASIRTSSDRSAVRHASTRRFYCRNQRNTWMVSLLRSQLQESIGWQYLAANLPNSAHQSPNRRLHEHNPSKLSSYIFRHGSHRPRSRISRPILPKRLLLCLRKQYMRLLQR